MMRNFLRSSLRLTLSLIVVLSVSLPVRAQRPPTAPSHAPDRIPAIKNIFWQPDNVKQGSPVLLTVELSGPGRDVRGSWLGKRIVFSRSDKPGVWIALAGADVSQQPGNFELKVRAIVHGRKVEQTKPIELAEAQFGTGQANVAQDYVHPTPDEERKVARDAILKKRVLSRFTPRPLWRGDFERPIAAEPTPSFGESRVMNGEKESHHLGTDFPAKEGTPVYASNAGVVALAAPLFYEGNCVIIDHGDGLFTIYLHLEKMLVRRGQRVRKHAEIGLSGRTGRVTGPNLHFEVVWEGNHLDPVQLLALTMPRVAAH